SGGIAGRNGPAVGDPSSNVRPGAGQGGVGAQQQIAGSDGAVGQRQKAAPHVNPRGVARVGDDETAGGDADQRVGRLFGQARHQIGRADGPTVGDGQRVICAGEAQIKVVGVGPG